MAAQIAYHAHPEQTVLTPLPTPERYVLTPQGCRTLAALHGQQDAQAGHCARPARWGAHAGAYYRAYLAALR